LLKEVDSPPHLPHSPPLLSKQDRLLNSIRDRITFNSNNKEVREEVIVQDITDMDFRCKQAFFFGVSFRWADKDYGLGYEMM
jgi:hypothetical protein